MKEIILFFILIFNVVYADDVEFIKQVFSKLNKTEVFTIQDSISENPINTKIHKVLSKSDEVLGYYRRIITTTGCNSACLPIHVTLFYTKNKKFMTLKSKKGLTKKNHVAFSSEDYSELELILNINPIVFKSVSHPKDMVDVITGQTTKVYSGSVVKEAAYSSLRINKYNQDTLNKLKGI